MTEKKMQLVDWLDDLCVRFIVNLPREELESVERICFQIEEAQWFYEDFIRPLDPNLPSLNLRQFCQLIFQHCPLLSGFTLYHQTQAFSEFLAYKTRVPVRGAIMLNEAMDHAVLVKGWKKNANWSFPRGKINKDERDLDCAIREVYEETGFDIRAANVIVNENDVKYIEVTMREQHMRLYVFRGIPMDANFQPRTRKEISKIQWYKLSELPTQKKVKQQQQEGRLEDLAVNANKFYMVAPFLAPLKKWISQQRKRDSLQVHPRDASHSAAQDSGMRVENGNLGATVTVDPPQSDDINRLVNQLRNSSHVKSSVDVAELSGPDSSNDVLTQLKNGQSAPPNASAETNTRNQTARSQNDKAKAMLSLLRSGANPESSQSILGSQQPQPLFEQAIEPLQPLPSLKHQFSQTPLTQKFPPAPASLYSPDEGGKLLVERALHTANTMSQAPKLSQELSYQKPPNYSLHASQLAPTIPQSSSLPLAPYQRTGDPQFAEGPRHLQNQPPSIPPANTLPPPKLTAHSSVLLNLFKSGPSPNPSSGLQLATGSLSGENAKIDINQNTPVTRTAVIPDSVLPSASVTHQPQAIRPPTAPKALEQIQNTASFQNRSKHQETLLNLFRTPSSPAVPKAHTSTPSLAPPTTLVELSAQSSPNHSRVSSEVKEDTTRAPMLSGRVTIQKRPDTSPKPAQAPVSATVTGPLPFPQFEKAAKRPANGKVAVTKSETLNAARRTSKPRIQPTMILPRPMVERVADDPLEKKKSVSPKRTHESQPRSGSSLANTTTDSPSQQKPFQPQLLRRPKDPQPTQELPRLKSPALTPGLVPPSAVSPKDNILPDRLRNQTQDQKNALLSLFTKTQSVISPPTPTRLSMVSPVSEKQILPDSVLPSPPDKSRSRLGSLNSLLVDTVTNGNGGVRTVNSKETAKASPVDKQFLLGFLAGVVKEGK